MRTEAGHRRFACLDGLRGAAALLVLAHHVSFVTGESFRSPLGRVLERTDAGVQVFFVLSAYLLYRPFVERRLAGHPDPPVAGFWLRRGARIFPGYWVALAGCVAFFGLKFFARTDVVVFGTLTQVYDISRFNQGISQSWSLATELGFYALLPLLAWLGAKAWRGRAPRTALATELCALTALALVAYGARQWAYSTEAPVRRLIGYWTIGNLDAFAIGMALALVVCYVESAERGPLLHRWARVWPWWLAAGAVLWWASAWSGLPLGFAEFSAHHDFVRQVSYVTFASLLVVPLALWPDGPGLARAALRSRLVGFVGLVSYGLYLWHQAVLSRIVDADRIFRAPFWTTLAAGIVATSVIATLSYLLVEKPLLDWARVATRGSPRASAGRRSS